MSVKYFTMNMSKGNPVPIFSAAIAVLAVFAFLAPAQAHAQSFPFSPFGGGRSGSPLDVLNPANFFGGRSGGLYASPQNVTIPPRNEPPRQPPPHQPPTPPHQPPSCSYSCHSSFTGPIYYHVPQPPPPRPYPVPVPRPYPVPYPVPQPYPYPQPVYYPQPQPVYYPQPQPIFVAQPQPIYIPQPQPIIVAQPQPIVIAQPTYPQYPAQLSVSCSPDATTVMNHRFVTWSAYVSGGLAPYSYSWSGTANSTLANESSIYVYYEDYGMKYMNVTVTSADGRTATASCGSVDIIDP